MTVFKVPQLAVLASDFGRFVYVIDEHNAVIQRSVIAGDWIGKDWIILNGLNVGDRVVVDNLIKLSPGKIVDPQLRGAVSSSHSTTSS